MTDAAYQREWVKHNHEKKLEYQRNWRKRHPEIFKAQCKRQNKKHRERYWDLKRQPCADCKIQYEPWIMQFDHLRDKKFTIASMFQRVTVEMLEEVKKCEVVCANCHADRTH